MTRVVFDGSILGAGPITGVAGAFLTTLHHYVATSPFDCTLLLPEAHTAPPPFAIETAHCLAPGRRHRLRSLRRACRDLGAGLLHSPVTAIPTRNPCPVIATIHDLPWRHATTRGETGSRWTRRLAAHLAARSAAAVIVPSRATQTDLLHSTKIDARAVHVIPHGIDPVDIPAATDELTGPFVVLGDDRPRKNCARVAQAYASAEEQDETLPGLVFLGTGHGSGYVPDAEKWHQLRRARGLIHAALLEGYGIPVLEAFAHGVPVICSDTTSLPEVAGDAALLVSPEDEASITAAILRLHRDDTLRDELRTRGLARAAESPAADSARAWVDLHRRLLAPR